MIRSQMVCFAIIMTIPCHPVHAFWIRSHLRSSRSTILQLNGDTTRDSVNGLLKVALERARSNLSTVTNLSTSCQPQDSSCTNPIQDKAPLEDILDATIQQAARSRSSETERISAVPSRSKQETVEGPKLLYRGNPAITNTALAHSLWSSILRPRVDTAIDATCGNGHDSIALARMLFPLDKEGCNPPADSLSRLICMDVQARAYEATKQAFSKDYASFLKSGHIQVLQTSHSPLPIEWAVDEDSLGSVALVVYNLGWLPSNTDGTKEYITQVDTTLQSMVDAMLLLRVGGMLSVVTYPKTNWEEDVAVRTFLECAALLSSNIQTWEQFLDENGESMRTDIVALLRSSMERLEGDGKSGKTWRVSEHKKLGMDRAPILLTAMRIK